MIRATPGPITRSHIAYKAFVANVAESLAYVSSKKTNQDSTVQIHRRSLKTLLDDLASGRLIQVASEALGKAFQGDDVKRLAWDQLAPLVYLDALLRYARDGKMELKSFIILDLLHVSL